MRPASLIPQTDKIVFAVFLQMEEVGLFIFLWKGYLVLLVRMKTPLVLPSQTGCQGLLLISCAKTLRLIIVCQG